MDFAIVSLVRDLAPRVMAVAVFAPLVLYLIVRWRASREAVPDPQLGIKLVLYYFASLAFQLAVAGFVLLVFSLIKPSSDSLWPDGDSRGGVFRMAFGMIVPAALVLGAELVLIPRTNDAQHPGVRRLFVAINLMLAGLAAFAALVLAFQVLFANGSAGGLGHLAASATILYGAATGLLGWRYHAMVIGGGVFGAREMPDVVLPPPPPDQPVAQGGGLPSLGSAFPPIDQPPK
jgi:hypothetical protein